MFSYPPKPLSRFPGPKKDLISEWPAANTRVPKETEVFDYIVVGGGGTGCPFARTLAENGAKVLILERGDSRDYSPITWDISGGGRAFNDRKVAQPILTKEGVVTHTGFVLGGGTSINFGIYIEEAEDYFEHLNEKYSGVQINANIFKKAQTWVRQRIAFPTAKRPSYHKKFRELLLNLSSDAVPIGHSPQLEVGKVWGGFSQFGGPPDPSLQYRHSADTLLTDSENKISPNLIIALNSTVTRIHFEPPPSEDENKLAAKCVDFVPTTDQMRAAVLSRRNQGIGIMDNPSSFMDWLQWFPPVANLAKKLFWAPSSSSFSTTVSEEALHFELPIGSKRVCLNPANPEAEIVLAAGPIWSPWLLMNSGIGPKQEIRKLQKPLLLDVQAVGANLKDRIFIPIIFFLDTFANRVPPAIVQELTMQRVGNLTSLSQENDRSCQQFSIGERSKQCGYLPVEELSGGQLCEGAAFASRFFFPPSMRGNLAVDTAMNILTTCAEDEMSDLRIFGFRVCPLVQPIIACMRKAAAQVYVLAEPRSPGRLSVGGPDRKSPFLTGAYLTDRQDLLDSVRGVSHLIEAILNSSRYDQIFERFDGSSQTTTAARRLSASQCPMILKTQLSSLLYKVGEVWTDYVSPEEVRAASQALEDTLFPETWAAEGEQDLEEDGEEEDDGMQDQYEVELLSVKKSSAPSNKNSKGEEASSSLRNEETLAARMTSQRYLSFPPVLPSPKDPRQVANFVKRWQTSMWHWHGSLAMGEVVDSGFRFLPNFISNLAVIDSSVIPKISRMNPTATVMALGRYAGLLRTHYAQSSLRAASSFF